MQNTVELNEKNAVESKTLKDRIVLAIVKLVAFGMVVGVLISLFVTLSIYTVNAWSSVKEFGTVQYTIAKYKLADTLNLVHYSTKIVPVNEAKIEEIVTVYSSKYGVNPIVAWSIIDKESSLNPNRVRFEQGWKDDYGKSYPKPSWMNPIEYDLTFSSFGLMQVSYIIWKDFCRLNSYTDLFIPERNIDCGLKIIRQCLEDNKHITKNGQRLRLCLKQFNGSGPKADQYANDAMARIADYTIEDKILLAAETPVGIEPQSAQPEKAMLLEDSVAKPVPKVAPIVSHNVPQIVSKKLNQIRYGKTQIKYGSTRIARK